MNATAKLGLFLAGGICVVCVTGKHLPADGDYEVYTRSLEKRPYADRDLAQEYGLDPDWTPATGVWAGASNGSYALQFNNALEAEASRIQIEFEQHAGTGGALMSYAFGGSINPNEIARNRFEDQGLRPPPPD
jgi:hypothetical protein